MLYIIPLIGDVVYKRIMKDFLQYLHTSRKACLAVLQLGLFSKARCRSRVSSFCTSGAPPYPLGPTFCSPNSHHLDQRAPLSFMGVAETVESHRHCNISVRLKPSEGGAGLDDHDNTCGSPRGDVVII